MRKGLLALVVVLASTVAFAQEAAPPLSGIKDLSAGLPTAIVDGVTLPATKWEAAVAVGYVTNGMVYETGLIALTYGVLDNVQATAKWPLILGEGHLDGTGDTVLALTWAAVNEEDMMPGMGLEFAGSFPTGEGFTGYNGTITGIASKSFGDVRALLNAGYTTIGKNGAWGRDHTDSFALGMDYSVLDNMNLIADVFSNMAPVKGGDRVEGIEVGIRTALTDVDILSVGVGAGIGNGNVTPDFTATVGYQRAF